MSTVSVVKESDDSLTKYIHVSLLIFPAETKKSEGSKHQKMT